MQFITVPPATSQPPAGLIVTLHGWGANAQDVASLLPFFNLPDYQFMFPNAPYPHPHSPVGRAWYDLRTENMYQGLAESRQLLVDWLQSLETSTGVPLSRTILSGFSQGGAMTLDVGLNLPLAGLVVMSGYLHPGAGTVTQSSIAPILITHGRYDEVVPLQAALKARETVESQGVAVEYHEFDMGHEIQPQMLEVVRNFVGNAIN
ncbi:alpha/beta hydrolase [Komarekiella sp. 'clone 1']|uniref:Alpha/beta hydrolase n=1 Tax=Komarekiella delphini-convector SJRDD-AB1 TaxID=2593771 RepID=A0AA40VSK8_9NOST|nr:alpha/beta hydrolase [Komarekiella delphini-convector]MBD6618107.1 alpha/beta hydrolase [Komarekiella delphini-convector SJRDD-AB1]